MYFIMNTFTMSYKPGVSDGFANVDDWAVCSHVEKKETVCNQLVRIIPFFVIFVSNFKFLQLYVLVVQLVILSKQNNKQKHQR